MLHEISLEILDKLFPQPIEKNEFGLFPFPRERCGILSCFLEKDGDIYWGCVESNRVGPTVISPPAGVQDIIAVKGEQQFSLEAAKFLPDFDLPFLKDYVGKLFREEEYQTILTLFTENGYEIYFENPLITAIQEAEEEHGFNLNTKAQGNHCELVDKLYQLPLKKTSGVQDSKTQQFWLAFLKNNENVLLKHTIKIDQKIQRNRGQEFYEKGRWGTLNQFQAEFKQAFAEALLIYQAKPEKLELLALFLETHWKTIRFLEKMEAELREELNLAKPKTFDRGSFLPAYSFFASNFLKDAAKLHFSFSKHALANIEEVGEQITL